MRLRDLSIKWKLVLTMMLVCTAALVVSDLLLVVYEYSAIQGQMQRDLTTLARITAANSTAALSFDDIKAANDTLSALAARPSVKSACLYDKNGAQFTIYYQGNVKSEVPGKPGEDGFVFGPDRLSIVAPVMLDNERIGTIYICSDQSMMYSWLWTFALVSGGILLLAGILGLFLASLVQRPFLAPILDLSETARQVSVKKDYSIRAAKVDSQDELAFLVERFNEMIEQIQMRDLALEQARAELEYRVEIRTRDLKELNKELEAFSYSVAHDLRAPLRGIDGFSQALMEDYGPTLDKTAHDYLQRVRSATQRMGHLLDDMLNLSKVTRSVVQPADLDLNELSKDIIAGLREQAPRREVDFAIADKLLVKADPGLMRIAFENLLGNAWKFTSKRPNPKIEVGKNEVDGKTVYFVRDNGAGFDMKYATKLFNVFHRLHKDSDFPGTGVGLATVQRIIHRHGGKLWAEGEVNAGATFYFTLNERG